MHRIWNCEDVELTFFLAAVVANLIIAPAAVQLKYKLRNIWCSYHGIVVLFVSSTRLADGA